MKMEMQRRIIASHTVKSVLAGLVLAAVVTFGVPLAANAAGEPCAGNPPSCGYLRNSGGYSFQASTDYVNTTTVATGAKKQTVAPGSRTSVGWDWDAVWVPAGRCVKTYGGAFWNVETKTNRVGQVSGRWHKVDNWGASVYMYAANC